MNSKNVLKNVLTWYFVSTLLQILLESGVEVFAGLEYRTRRIE